MSVIGTDPEFPGRLTERMRRSALSLPRTPPAERSRVGPVLATGLDPAADLPRR
ncbi:hypothetical protein [Nocardiopsis deserti]|uniref:hypothetical protein n=1 Tax=Nocardiopsis deserti TaxID=2605988 RepID=UPI00168119D2|nr:hypothetical protein [Nocardiopsis deserti]